MEIVLLTFSPVVNVIFFGGNLDFPKIQKLNKICSDVWTCTKMSTQCYFQAKLFSKTVYFKMASSYSFSSGGNLDFPDFVQKIVL